MRWETAVQHHPKVTRLVIEEDPTVGFYLYVFEGDDDACAWDYLQDTLDAAMEQAQFSYGVSKGAWRQSN